MQAALNVLTSTSKMYDQIHGGSKLTVKKILVWMPPLDISERWNK